MRIYAVLICFIIILSPSPAVSTEQLAKREPRDLPARLAPAAAGGETSGDILLRAHQYDIDAITQTIAGYGSGQRGFHKDTSLAKAWLKPLLMLGAMNAYGVSALYVDLNEGRILENLGRSIAHCELARKSRFTPEFEKTGLFDLEKICLELEDEKKNNKKWKNEYEQALYLYKKINNEVRKVATILRELPRRPAATEEQEAIDISSNSITLPLLLHYLATTNNTEEKKSDWSIEKLYSFIFYQQKFSSNKKTPCGFSLFINFVASTVMDHAIINDNKDTFRKLLNDAHNGDIKAMRMVASYYQRGVSLFPQDIQLAQAWVQSGALEGDSASMLRLATLYFENGHMAAAWSFVNIIKDFNESDKNLQHMAAQLIKIIESLPDKENIQQRGKDIALDFFDKSEERMKWRLEHSDM